MEELIRERANAMAQRKGITIPFELSVSNDESLKDYLLVLCAGHVPHIILNQTFVLRELISDKKVTKLKYYLEIALERLPLVHHTLGHLVPNDYAIALREDTRRWVKTLFKNFIEYIPDKYISVSYTVHVKDEVTGTVISLSGDNIREIELQAKARLIRMLISDEKFDELREMVKAAQLAKQNIADSKPVRIVLAEDANGNPKMGMEY